MAVVERPPPTGWLSVSGRPCRKPDGGSPSLRTLPGLPARRCGDAATDWFRAWTGNSEVDGDALRVFGQDGTGGYAAFWLNRPGQALEEQPVVFLGSEGETGVIAPDLGAFPWPAGGFGPSEARRRAGTRHADAARTRRGRPPRPQRRDPPLPGGRCLSQDSLSCHHRE